MHRKYQLSKKQCYPSSVNHLEMYCTPKCATGSMWPFPPNSVKQRTQDPHRKKTKSSAPTLHSTQPWLNAQCSGMDCVPLKITTIIIGPVIRLLWWKRVDCLCCIHQGLNKAGVFPHLTVMPAIFFSPGSTRSLQASLFLGYSATY